MVGAIVSVVFCALVFLGLGYAVWRMQWRPQLAVTLALRKLPRKPISQLVPGERCYVVGTVRCELLTTASGSGRRCVLYATRLLARGRGPVWDSVAMGGDFALEDGTGRIRVVSNGVIDADVLTSWRGALPGVQAGTVFGSSVMQREIAELGRGANPVFAEGVIEPDQRIAVAGTVERNDDGTLLLVGRVDAPLIVTDHGRAVR